MLWHLRLADKLIYRLYSYLYDRVGYAAAMRIKYSYISIMSRVSARRYKQLHQLYMEYKPKATGDEYVGVKATNVLSGHEDSNREYKEVLVVGPNADIEDIKSSVHRTLIVINKITQSSIALGEDVLYVLNMSWGSKNKKLINAAAAKGQIIYLPETGWLSELNEYQNLHEYGSIISSYTLSELGVSPMGLQRALIILISGYKFEKLVLRGFDFGLSKYSYKDWYPIHL